MDKMNIYRKLLVCQIGSKIRNKFSPGDQANIVFIWIPKTAGTAVFRGLRTAVGMKKLKFAKDFIGFNNRGAVSFGHVSYLDLRATGIVRTEFHNSAFKFCVVRNPYNRVVSIYNYFRQYNRIDKAMEFESFLDALRTSMPPVGLYHYAGLSQANPQITWMLDDKGELLVDAIYRVEDLQDLVNDFRSRFGIDLNLNSVHNASMAAISLEEVIANSAAREKIEILYDRDFAALGYDHL